MSIFDKNRDDVDFPFGTDWSKEIAEQKKPTLIKIWVFDANIDEMLNTRDEEVRLEGNEIFLIEKKHFDELRERYLLLKKELFFLKNPSESIYREE